MVPTVQDTCGRFSSLANVNGSRAVNLTQSFREAPASSVLDEGYAIVSLPFVFRWRGIDQYSEILVNTNGAVYPGSDREKLLLCRWNNALCWTASKVVLEGNYEVPRIAAAQEDLDLTNTNGTIYAYSTIDTMIISFEGIGLFDDDAATLLNFQVVLEEGGRIELRWGNGSLPEGRQVAAGVEDDIHNVAAPATGGPFNLQGVTAGGRWPGFSCRTFVPINGTYVEWSPLAE